MAKLNLFIMIFLMGGILLWGLKHTGFWDDVASKEELVHSTPSALTEDFAPYDSTWNLQISLNTFKGEKFDLNKLKGQKAFLLNFWASWCAPCREEFADLVSAVKWSQGRLSLVAISNDSSAEDIHAFLNDLKKAGVIWKQKDVYILWDPEFKVAKQFNVTKWPETFIVDQRGQIVKKYVGVFSFPKAQPFLSQILLWDLKGKKQNVDIKKD